MNRITKVIESFLAIISACIKRTLGIKLFCFFRVAENKTNISVNRLMALTLEFIRRSSDQMEKFFPLWKTSGETYMIPPAPVTKFLGPIDEDASGYDSKIVANKLPIIEGDSAEAIVHRFLSISGQHAFVLQNFTTSNWKRILGSRGLLHQDNPWGKLLNMDDIEIDFLILHAYAGIIAIECKSVKTFLQKRYTSSKKQLDKVDVLIATIEEIFESNQNGRLHGPISVQKVVSFPLVEMRQDVESPFNLGKLDLSSDPGLWWNRLIKTETAESPNNLFQNDTFYNDMVCLLLGMYNAVELSIG